jgi:chitin disaccharide deacetylase
MTGGRYLIVNADDFGLSPGVNRGVVAAHEGGIVSSTSLMVRWPAATEAARYARDHVELDVGLHIDLGEWAFRDGAWIQMYRVVMLNDEAAVRTEIQAQVDTFRRLVGREPTHLDSHQHVHRREPVRSAVCEFGRELAVPVRHFGQAIHYCGDFYGQDGEGNTFPNLVTPEALIEILKRLPPGVTELSCHPGEVDDLGTMYVHERVAEVRALCHPAVKAAVADLGIELVSFGRLPLDLSADR